MSKKTYWNGEGRYQKEYESLEHLVPFKGMADTLHGEALRRVQRVYYDLYNNGACNDKWNELWFVYDWLDKVGAEYKQINGGRNVNGDKLYLGSRYDDAYFERIAAELETLADTVVREVQKANR